VGVLAVLLALVAAMPAAGAAAAADPFAWLEEVGGARAQDWVRVQNARTAARLDQDPRYPALYREALAITAASGRLPLPALHGGAVFSLLQDADHVHGLWRRASLGDYRRDPVPWRTVLDLDALAAREQVNWVLQGADCAEPAARRCLLQLSAGGEDAVRLREFDLRAGRFVDGGFDLPRGKQWSAWLSADELLVAREWTTSEVTASGYPFVVRRLRRGESPAQGKEVFRGEPSDVQVMPVVLGDGAGARVALIQRDVAFFSHQLYLVRDHDVAALALPQQADLQALAAGRLVLSLNADWADAAGTRFTAGSLVGFDVQALAQNPGAPRGELILAPAGREVVQQVGAAGGRLLVTLLDNVRGRAAVLAPAAHGPWQRRALALPDNASVDLVDVDRSGGRAILAVTGFLQPTGLWLADLSGGRPRRLRQAPPNFDASRDVVEQFAATSTDGTRIPYFVVHARAAPRDGSTPTVMTAYGGFQVAVTPYYGGYEWLHEPMYTTTGKLWLERGGTLVVANIRGGGEFGPAWHEAGLKTQRQRIYDDFAAVARDLDARGIASPRHLGIFGLSNGGLLMGVEFTQHPELWNAVDIAVPLLDMLGYEHIEAGASWVSEYGSTAVPAEREFLARISPYQNLHADVQYPEPLIWTMTHDDRVGPEHARKFAAQLAAFGKPYLFYEATDGGHDPTELDPAAAAAMQAREFVYFLQRLQD
jgi:prolyl oligopeptidase